MCHVIMNNIRSPFVTVDRLDISNGELMVLIGPSGAGKSSLLNILAGFIPHTGEILLDNRPIQTLPPHCRRIGYLFQDLYLFPHMTVSGNLKIALKTLGLKKEDARERINSLLDLFRISHIADSYPGRISGGEKQRAAMARTIARQPDLLLLDEPLSHLDYQTARYLRAQFKQIQRKLHLTTLFVTHDLQEAEELGDRIFIMENGQLQLPEQGSAARSQTIHCTTPWKSIKTGT